MFKLTPQEETAVRTGQKRLAMALSMLEFIASQKQGATCDEVMVALKLPHQSAAPRYHELVQTGCLVPLCKRTTRSGALAMAHLIAPEVNFKDFLTYKPKPKAIPGISEFDGEVLAAGLDFLKGWKRSKSVKGREAAVRDLIRRLTKLA